MLISLSNLNKELEAKPKPRAKKSYLMFFEYRRSNKEITVVFLFENDWQYILSDTSSREFIWSPHKKTIWSIPFRYLNSINNIWWKKKKICYVIRLTFLFSSLSLVVSLIDMRNEENFHQILLTSFFWLFFLDYRHSSLIENNIISTNNQTKRLSLHLLRLIERKIISFSVRRSFWWTFKK